MQAAYVTEVEIREAVKKLQGRAGPVLLPGPSFDREKCKEERLPAMAVQVAEHLKCHLQSGLRLVK
jgi:hypothetical protein